jgi:hypothetical protein
MAEFLYFGIGRLRRERKVFQVTAKTPILPKAVFLALNPIYLSKGRMGPKMPCGRGFALAYKYLTY